jgi:hypothetical protein
MVQFEISKQDRAGGALELVDVGKVSMADSLVFQVFHFGPVGALWREAGKTMRVADKHTVLGTSQYPKYVSSCLLFGTLDATYRHYPHYAQRAGHMWSRPCAVRGGSRERARARERALLGTIHRVQD